MIRYVKKRWTTPLFADATGTRIRLELLWGDRVRVIRSDGDLWLVKARGLKGFVAPGHLGSQSLLELYFIDVGQGDGVFIRTPDNRHLMIDGGWPRRSQPTGKNAADFVDWKFFKDYEESAIALDAMICSHNDQDHYGGLWDLLDVSQLHELDCQSISVEAFYHAGLSWWKAANGRTLGPSVNTSLGQMWTRLLEDRGSLQRALRTSGSQPKLQGEWARFLGEVLRAKTKTGADTPVLRLSSGTAALPGFDDPDGLQIKVLAPVAFEVGGKPAIRKFAGGDSKNTNGNSVLLRLDYKAARILLTGDLNTACQQALLVDYAGDEEEFECDVAKACHHGSGDVSLAFLEAMKPACTIFSSGDSEGHDHPRPNIVAAAGLTGFRTIEGDQLVTPLVFSTELARSIAIGRIHQVDRLGPDRAVLETIAGDGLATLRTNYSITMAGDRNPKSGSGLLNRQRLAAKTTYGLINLRTDGRSILCAALNEKSFRWNVSAVPARFGQG